MRTWVIVGFIVGVIVAMIAAHFLPERDTVITRDVLSEEIRRTATEFGPLVNDFKDLKK